MVSKKTVDTDAVEVAPEATDAVLTTEPVVDEPVSAPAETINAERRTEHTSCRAESGDSYLRIADRYAPMGVSVREYAQRLMEANGGKPVTFGTKIILPR
jgi:hypothetical protein